MYLTVTSGSIPMYSACKDYAMSAQKCYVSLLEYGQSFWVDKNVYLAFIAKNLGKLNNDFHRIVSFRATVLLPNNISKFNYTDFNISYIT